MQDTGLPHLPGAATVSEVLRLLELGYAEMKFFPAEVSGGVGFLKAIGAPVPQARFCPTGGITPASAPSYLSLANVGCVGGTWLTPADALRRRRLGPDHPARERLDVPAGLSFGLSQPSILLTAEARSCGSKGFTSTPATGSVAQWRCSESWALAVNRTIGMRDVSGISASRRQAVGPSITGIITSIRMASGSSLVARLIASCPVAGRDHTPSGQLQRELGHLERHRFVIDDHQPPYRSDRLRLHRTRVNEMVVPSPNWLVAQIRPS